MDFEIDNIIKKEAQLRKRAEVDKEKSAMDAKIKPWEAAFACSILAILIFFPSLVLVKMLKPEYSLYLEVLFCVSSFLFFMSFFFGFTSNRHKALKKASYNLQDINEKQLIKVSEWLSCPEIANYCKVVGTQDRKLVNGEFNMLESQFNKYMGLKNIDEANKSVYQV